MGRAEERALDRDAEALYKAVTKLTKVVQFRDRDAICCRGVSVTQCYALEALVWHGPQSVNGLADFLLLDSSTVSRVVDTLARKGLVSREVNLEDRRAVILSATEEGRQICLQITEDMKAREKELIADLGPEQRNEMIRLVERLAAEYEERARAMSTGCDCSA
jgi:MarR family 2-MHQ and catechol resistance regulon transcriptional repressor